MKRLTRLSFMSFCLGLLVSAMSATMALANQNPSTSLLAMLADPDATLADVMALLDAGANPAARNQDGKTPWDMIPQDSSLRGTDAYWRLNDARFQ